jgi:hypothetical protein
VNRENTMMKPGARAPISPILKKMLFENLKKNHIYYVDTYLCSFHENIIGYGLHKNDKMFK